IQTLSSPPPPLLSLSKQPSSEASAGAKSSLASLTRAEQIPVMDSNAFAASATASSPPPNLSVSPSSMSSSSLESYGRVAGTQLPPLDLEGVWLDLAYKLGSA